MPAVVNTKNKFFDYNFLVVSFWGVFLDILEQDLILFLRLRGNSTDCGWALN